MKTMLILSVIIIFLAGYTLGYYKGMDIGYNSAMKELLMERFNLRKKITPVNIQEIKEIK